MSEGEVEVTPEQRMRFHAEMGVDQWLQAMIWQGQRCLDLVDQRATYGQRHPNPTGGGFQELFTRSRIDEHFFANATWKAIDWRETLLQIRPELTPLAEELLQYREAARDVRDMREHDREYLFGDGRRRKRFVVEGQTTDGGSFRADATSTLVTGETHLVGGRLSIRELIAIAERLRARLPQPGRFLWGS